MTPHRLWRPLTPGANAARQGERIARRQTPPGEPTEYCPHWAKDARRVKKAICEALGDRVLKLEHVGSTSVPGMIAKPVIDLDLTVADVEDEAVWLPGLVRIGYRLIFRDQLRGDPHSQLTLAQPNTNLHVWSPGAVEPLRHLLFRDWLRTHQDDRDRYAIAKRSALSAPVGTYNDNKSAVVHEIHDRIFAEELRRGEGSDAG